jgi:Fic family protein
MFEAKNLARVVEYIRTKAVESPLGREILILLHRMLLSNIRDEIAGRFRRINEWVRVGSHLGCPPADIDDRISALLVEYNSDPSLPITERIARFHLEFETIHPFVDGNGRIGRVLNNYLLIRDGYVPINISFVDRSRYFDAFENYHARRSTKEMEELIFLALSNSYHKRLAYLEDKTILTLGQYAKKHAISHSGLINKAKRQTIDAFLERGIWKIGQ